MTTPPSPYEHLKHLADESDATRRAQEVGKALNAIPELQTWLSTLRQAAVQEMHEGGLSYEQIGKELGMHRVRAHQIAKGLSSGKRTTSKPRTGRQKPGTE